MKANESTALVEVNRSCELTIGELDAASGGQLNIKGAVTGVCTKSGSAGQNDAAAMFQQILNQLTQG
ncbi:MAG: hypothetical protein K2X57_25210 [Xanthobacteraceae bacterium]|nr:hypothetical protein [Xanthobacteraceae bacterium]